jgi:hypothetical protein
MGIVYNLVKDMPLPRMVRIRQFFDSDHIGDIDGAVREALIPKTIAGMVKPGMRIAVTAGSRGITNIAVILKALVENLRQIGAEPFVIPAMGSHGGATAGGQREVLTTYGITEQYIGCPIFSSMAVKQIGFTSDRRPVQIDSYAAQADGIIPVNRIKPHTSFTGPYESGLMKMLAIGLAKQAGAEVCHQEGYGKMAENIEKYGRAILQYAKVLFGVAILENALDQTGKITAIPGDQIISREPELLLEAKALMPKILFPNLDVLVVDRMGKNISGLGMDPHITGCFATAYASGPPRPDKLVVLDLTEETHGNANGIGVADVSTRRLFGKFDPEMTYPNALTATLTQAVRLPIIMDNQKLAIQAAIKTAAGFDKKRIRLVRIQDTLHLGDILISEALLEEAIKTPGVEVLGPPEEMVFNEEGDLF